MPTPPVVEMAGVEPASRKIGQKHTTSLVGHLLVARMDPDQQGSTQTSRCGAPSLPTSDPTYRRPWEGTPSFMSPASLPPGSGKGRT